jgi:hypothetical protein
MADAEVTPRSGVEELSLKRSFLELLPLPIFLILALTFFLFPKYMVGILLSFLRSEIALAHWKGMGLHRWAIPIVFTCQIITVLLAFWAEDRIAANKGLIRGIKRWLREKLGLTHLTIHKKVNRPSPIGWRMAMYASLAPLAFGFESMPIAVSLVKVHRLHRGIALIILLGATLLKDLAVVYAIDGMHRYLGGWTITAVWMILAAVCIYLLIKFLLEE